MDSTETNPEMSWEYSFYTIKVDGWKFGDVTNTAKYLYILDSGTTLCYLPPRKHSLKIVTKTRY